MAKKHPLLWLIPLVLLLLLIPFIVPSALPVGEAEGAVDLPVFTPVELSNPHPDPMPMPGMKDSNPTLYIPQKDRYVLDPETGFPMGYEDGTIYIKVETRIINNTKVFFTWIQIADPSQLRTWVTRGENNPMAEAKKMKAVLAINGDWFSGRKEGVIYRNGQLMRPAKPFGNYDTLIIDDEGDFHILYRPEDNAFDPYLDCIMHSFMFGPGLVIDGELQTFEGNNYGSGPGMGLQVNAQRQALCQMGKLTYLIITTEGPKDKSDKVHGFNVPQLAQLCYDMGAVNAYNLDGGNSAALILNGVKINSRGYREVTDIIYFVTAEAPPAETAVPAENVDEGSAAP